MTNVLVTGGAGFIGSNFVRHALTAHPDWKITTLDKLTYAGRLENLKSVDHPRHEFVKADVADPAVASPRYRLRRRRALRGRNPRRPIDHERRRVHHNRRVRHVRPARGGAWRAGCESSFRSRPTKSTGASPKDRAGNRRVAPRNPYSASKAGADRLAYSYWATYQVPVVITRASNNYGPNQFPEKIIPLFITNAMDDRQVPLYGDGMNVRDWLHVSDNCRAVDPDHRRRNAWKVYNVGGGNHVKNVDLTRRILQLLGKPESLIRPVADRPGHDRRYSVDTAKLHGLGWKPDRFEQGLAEAVSWYQQNEWW